MKKVLPVQGTGGKVPQGAYSLERDRHVSDQYIDTILNNDKCSGEKKTGFGHRDSRETQTEGSEAVS